MGPTTTQGMKVAKDITELIGNTPLVRLNKMAQGCQAEILLKLEFYNPLGSVKDRIGLEMIEAAERDGKIKKDKELAESDSNYFVPQQFDNPANPEIHRKTTAEEIWNDTAGKVDFLISGIGTGGTITGVAEIIKKRKPTFKAIAVEPKG